MEVEAYAISGVTPYNKVLYRCPNCKATVLFFEQHFCHECGTEMLWDGKPKEISSVCSHENCSYFSEMIKEINNCK